MVLSKLFRGFPTSWGVMAVATWLMFASPTTCNANFLFTNFAADDALNSAGALAGFEASGAISVGFKVLAPITLTSVDLKLRSNTGSSATKDATLLLRNDNAGNPGTALASFNSVSATNAFQTASFAPTATVTLNASTTYWLTLGTTIVAGGDGDGLVAGSRSPSVNPSGTDGEFVGLRFGTPDVQIFSPLFSDSPSIQISGISVVPEPTSTLLFASLATGLIWRRRVRRS